MLKAERAPSSTDDMFIAERKAVEADTITIWCLSLSLRSVPRVRAVRTNTMHIVQYVNRQLYQKALLDLV